MLSQCANSQCSKPFLRLREGKLFLVDTGRSESMGVSKAGSGLPTRAMPRIERYWLCDQCSTQWTLVYDREQGIVLAPVRKRIASVPELVEAPRRAAR